MAAGKQKRALTHHNHDPEYGKFVAILKFTTALLIDAHALIQGL